MSALIIFGLMTLSAMFMVLLPLGWRQHDMAISDVDVYRAQLAEVERARAQGTVAAEESEGLRAEVARRLLQAVDRAGPIMSDALWRRRLAAVIAVVGVPIAAAVIYGAFGNPDMPDRPRAQRMQRAMGDETSALIGRVEKVLEQRPDDGRGWDLLAPVYLRVGRATDAAKAYDNAIRLLGSSPEREAGRGEALTIEAKGIVTPEARAAFSRAVEKDPENARARYFLARAKAQDGDRAGAAADMRALLAEGSEDAPWRSFVERAIEEFEGARP
ncbi:hypothetical protein GCM10007276_13180 [Agaricicola taiwanensis]|uniref:Cytochrome c-type biogenesis protein H TPR domain-containing protein n=1 Tax=Agaricicola taiwanensis TaxID=591372 RepID=A0A8J2VQH4_9RHOB|nr:c-type cytochrome biogenesis protein CcmI [Agaricicola taiwanensis]GGE37078.1 hypothetical protein GCM10007276_13180 [Agaricicola taiwanensis]